MKLSLLSIFRDLSRKQIAVIIILIAIGFCFIDFSWATLIGSAILGVSFGVWQGDKVRKFVFRGKK